MSITWLEVVGYCGTLATFVSYSMRTIVPLRIASISSSIFFITYGSLSGLWPVLATEIVLLPLNCVRLSQDLSQQQRTFRDLLSDIGFGFRTRPRPTPAMAVDESDD